MSVAVGAKAPDFTLPNQDREPVTLSEQLKKGPVVLAFMPAAFSGTCTTEMCTFRDSASELNKVNATVLGITVDTFFALKAWADAQALKFPLLSDFNKDVIRQHGVVNPDMIGLKDISKRATFVIDRERHRSIQRSARRCAQRAELRPGEAGARQSLVSVQSLVSGPISARPAIGQRPESEFATLLRHSGFTTDSLVHARHCRCRSGAHASAQSRSRTICARRNPGSQRRVQSGSAGHRQRRLLSRRASPHLRSDGRAQRAARPDRLRHAEEELARAGELDEVGGPAYVASLADGVPRATNVEYARIVKEKSTLRNLIYAANKIVANAYEAEQESDLILDEAESAIFAVADDRLKAGFVPMRDLVKESFPKIEQLFEQKRLITGVPTGFVDVDEMTRGLQAGDLVIVAARPSMGKTSLVLNIAQYVASLGDHVVGFFSLEMSKESLFLRLLTSEAQIDGHRLMSGAIGGNDYHRISHALERLNAMKLFIDDTASIGVLEMRAKSRRLQAEHGLNLLIVDYIQLMSGRGRFENRTLELASISRSLKGLAKELNVPIVVLSQLSRAPESRPIIARNCPTCGNPALSNRTPTSSC